jgi:hypothetical protein
MPLSMFPSSASPAALVPIKLPAIILLFEPAISMPSPLKPLMTRPWIVVPLPPTIRKPSDAARDSDPSSWIRSTVFRPMSTPFVLATESFSV